MTNNEKGIRSGAWSGAIRQRDFSLIIDWFWRYFAITGLVAVLAASVGYGTSHAKGPKTDDIIVMAFLSLKMFGSLALFAAASTACGWLLGLLFGIPRSLSRGSSQNGNDDPRQTGNLASTSRANTNLEDVSDWLTKTIVGVGLTALTTIPSKIWHYAGALSHATVQNQDDARLLFLSLFMYCTPGGFWIGYVGTRTILTKLFAWADRSMLDEKVNQVLESDILSLLKGIGDGDGLGSLSDADRMLLQIPLERIASAKELAAWGIAHARNGDLETAITALKQALHSEPGTEAYKVALAAIYTTQERYDEAAKLTNGITDQGPGRLLALQSALYEDPPFGYEKAIRIGEELAANSNAIDPRHKPMFNVWMACAYGQQYRQLIQPKWPNSDYTRVWTILASMSQDNPAIADARKNALKHIKAALENDSGSLHHLLRSLWQPAEGAVDNDLNGFAKDDPEMEKLLGS